MFPIPKAEFALPKDWDSQVRKLRAELKKLSQKLTENGKGKLLNISIDEKQRHPSGGCRLGDNPKSSVCDATGKTHDHPNLYVLGAPTMVSAGCVSSTLTFAALTLRTTSFVAKEHSPKTS